VGLAVLLAACSPSTGATLETVPPPESSAVVAVPSEPSTTTAPPATREDLAEAAAAKTVTDYSALLDRVAIDPTVPLDDLHNVAVDPNFSSITSDFARYRSQGDHLSGSTTVVRAVPMSVSLANTPTARPPVFPVVTMRVCIDISANVTTDVNGTNLVPNKPSFLDEQITVVNISYPDSTGWRVSDLTSRAVSSC
jgi:hypothetical protein